MAITLVSHGSNENTSGSFTIPFTCSAGDLILVLQTVVSNPSPSLTGETFTDWGNVGIGFNLWYTFAASSHSSANVSFSDGGAVMSAWDGMTRTMTFGTVNTSTGTSMSASVTPATANSQIVGFFTGSGTMAAATGETLIDQVAVPFASVSLADIQSNSVQSGSYTMTASQSISIAWHGLCVALAPPATSSRRRSWVQVI